MNHSIHELVIFYAIQHDGSIDSYSIFEFESFV